MDSKNTVDVALKFIEKINHRDFDGLLANMSADYKSMDEAGGVTQGREKAMNMIADYVKQRPDFQIHVNDIFLKDQEVFIIGRTTGSCADTSYEKEIKDRLIYVVKITDGLVAGFQYAVEDNKKNRGDLGIDSATKITE